MCLLLPKLHDERMYEGCLDNQRCRKRILHLAHPTELPLSLPKAHSSLIFLPNKISQQSIRCKLIGIIFMTMFLFLFRFLVSFPFWNLDKYQSLYFRKVLILEAKPQTILRDWERGQIFVTTSLLGSSLCYLRCHFLHLSNDGSVKTCQSCRS